MFGSMAIGVIRTGTMHGLPGAGNVRRAGAPAGTMAAGIGMGMGTAIGTDTGVSSADVRNVARPGGA